MKCRKLLCNIFRCNAVRKLADQHCLKASFVDKLPLQPKQLSKCGRQREYFLFTGRCRRLRFASPIFTAQCRTNRVKSNLLNMRLASELAPKKNPRAVILKKGFHFGGRVQNVDKIPSDEDITTLRAETIFENSLEQIRSEKSRFQQSKQISPVSSQAASATSSMATFIPSWVTFTSSGASNTLPRTSYNVISTDSSVLSSAANILFSTSSTILAWATYTTSFTFIVLLTTLCFATSNARLSIFLTFIFFFLFCLKSEWGRRRNI